MYQAYLADVAMLISVRDATNDEYLCWDFPKCSILSKSLVASRIINVFLAVWPINI